MKLQFPKELFSAKLLLEILLTHIDGAKVNRPTDPIRRTATVRLVEYRMLVIPHPKYWNYSVITERGRELLAQLLADYAEILKRHEIVATEKLATVGYQAPVKESVAA